MKWEREGPEEHNIISWTSYHQFWEHEFPNLKVSKRRADICNFCFVFANRRKYSYTPCFGDADSLSSVSSNTKSVGDEFEMEEVTHDEYNYDDNIDGAVQLDGIDEIAVDNNAMTCPAIPPDMIEKSVRHVHTAKAKRQYLRDCVADSQVDVNNNASHAEKHYVFICDFAQNIELPFLGDQQPGETIS
jgi:hypothetical protein